MSRRANDPGAKQKPGRDFGGTIEVLSGLGPDDAVVINPPDSIVDGSTVRVSSPPPVQAPKAPAKST